jgi:hypothetical protein
MTIVKWVLLWTAACAVAFADGEVLMSANALLHNGVSVRFETRLEPGSPSFAEGFDGGNLIEFQRVDGQPDREKVHRYFAYNALHKFFGYDLQVKPGTTKGSYDVEVQLLSIGPERIQLPDPASWSVIALPAYPGPQTVHEGETLAIQMFANPATGQKITDYVFFPRTGQTMVSAGRTSTVLADETSGKRKTGDADAQVGRTGPRYYVSGEVRRPGAYPLPGGKTVLEALVEAGGPADFAKKKAIYILRGKEKLPFNYLDVSKGKNLAQNVGLKDGDLIVVP